MDGISAVEKRILQEASARQLPGIRLEWNEDLDFGHMMDPVPVVVNTADGRSVEAHFSVQEMVDFAAGRGAEAQAKIDQLLQELAQRPGGERLPDSRGF